MKPNSDLSEANQTEPSLGTAEELAPDDVAPFQVTVEPRGPNAVTVSFHGNLAPTWLSNFALALAQRAVNISAGSATRVGSDFEAQFELEATPGGADPRDLDYSALAAQRSEQQAERPPRLEHTRAELTPGGLLLTVAEVPDRIGFLGTLLRQLEGLGLVANSLKLQTRAEKVYDELVLESVDGIPVGPQALREVRPLLDELLRNGETT